MCLLAPSEAVRSGRGRLPVGQARKAPHADQRAQVEDDCVWVERELIPWQTSCALDESEFRSMFDTAGVLKDLATLRTRVYYGGLAAGVRREGWKWLLGCYPAKSTRKDREALLVAKRHEYLAYKRQWQSITPEQQARFAKFRDRRSRTEKDVVRTDRGIEMFADAAGPGLERLHAILLTYSNDHAPAASLVSQVVSDLRVVAEGAAAPLRGRRHYPLYRTWSSPIKGKI